jgi:N utilization substance protein B
MRRSKGREVALQLLFERDLNALESRKWIERFVHARLNDAEVEAFCLALLDGFVANAAEIDQRLTAAAQNWRLPRMAAVDRNVLRLGAFELLHSPKIPASVVINEAIELARRFGSVGSPAFVNGVLDRVRQSAAASS